MTKLKFYNLSRIMPPLIFIILWQLAASYKWINPLFISSPSKIVQELYFMFSSGNIWPHLSVSLQEFIIGFVLALISGIFLGILIGWYENINKTFSPFIYGLYSTPKIALIPLIIIWAGLGIWSKVVVVFLGAFFPVLINTISGVRNLNPDYVRLGKSFGASDLKIFRTIAVPSAFPYILSGIKLSIGAGIIGVIVGEFYVSSKGLGYLISFYGATFQTGKLLAIIMLVVLITIFLTWSIEKWEKRLTASKHI